jgi:uncharacterized membrane protein YdjX (TVP38/TMEM64 family)
MQKRFANASEIEYTKRNGITYVCKIRDQVKYYMKKLMEHPLSSEEKTGKIKILLSVAVLLVLIVVAIPLFFFFRSGNLSSFLQASPALAPILFLFLQVAQIVIAFLPGGPIPLLGSAIFGTLPTILLCVAGSFIGTVIAYMLTQLFGTPLIRLFVKKQHFSRFSFLQNPKKAAWLVFFLFLCPGLPKDVLTYLLSFHRTIPPLRFSLLTTLARTPSLVLTVLLGDRLQAGDWKMALCFLLFFGICFLAGCFLKRRFRAH